jgi:hypothetical protein
MNFTSTHPDFQRKIKAISVVAGLTCAEVYEYWQQYSRQCTNYDQSPVMHEFINWYENELGGDRLELQSALDMLASA